MSVLFSTTKSLASTILAMVLDQQGVSYKIKVAEFWPEFAQNGKANISILNVVLHQAGLPYTDKTITRADVVDWKRMSKYFEEATPVGYPNLSLVTMRLPLGKFLVFLKVEHLNSSCFRFLIDQIVRRIDSKKRGVNDILKELTKIYDIPNLSIGLTSPQDNDRVATLQYPGDLQIEAEGRRDPEALRRWNAGNNEHHKRLYKTWPWISTEDYNSYENRALPMPSNMGVGNARSLAKFHSLLAERKILSDGFYKHFEQPVLEHEMDCVIGYEESKGYGFQFTKNPKDQWVFGHSGFGGQNVRVDMHNNLSYAYVCNGLKIADADLVEPWKRLVDKLYSLL
ncbi:beta-lactamase [Oesophagostomum dentatum]|uniref:Beta-lactamase n=1 Tax=Oesophagostomum dentatum TaxID=61180 RepID=A0A0B1RXM6_OESDE|nr:beta-lactamase [Oesophagostomum dentatum]